MYQVYYEELPLLNIDNESQVYLFPMLNECQCGHSNKLSVFHLSHIGELLIQKQEVLVLLPLIFESFSLIFHPKEKGDPTVSWLELHINWVEAQGRKNFQMIFFSLIWRNNLCGKNINLTHGKKAKLISVQVLKYKQFTTFSSMLFV